MSESHIRGLCTKKSNNIVNDIDISKQIEDGVY